MIQVYIYRFGGSIMYNKILVPIDITEEDLTKKVIPHVERLAKLANAQVIFFHALPVASAIVNAYSFGFDEFKDKATVQTEQYLHKLMESINLPQENLSFSIAFGNPRDEILSLANEIKPDLIILGSRRPNITTHLLGSNASGVVRGAQTSVLVVR